MSGPNNGGTSKLITTIRQDIQRGGLRGGDRRVAEVIVQHQRPDAQYGRDGGGHQRGRVRQATADVVGDHERIVTERFDAASKIPPLARRIAC